MESWTLHEDCLEWLILRPEFRPLFKKYPDVLAEAERRWKHIKTLIIKKA
jgi:hypothetical protein